MQPLKAIRLRAGAVLAVVLCSATLTGCSSSDPAKNATSTSQGAPEVDTTAEVLITMVKTHLDGFTVQRARGKRDGDRLWVDLGTAAALAAPWSSS